MFFVVRENPVTIARTRWPVLRSVRPSWQPLPQIAPDAWHARREDSRKHDRDRRENHNLGRAVASVRTDAEQPLDPIHYALPPFQTAQQALANIPPYNQRSQGADFTEVTKPILRGVFPYSSPNRI
jgi:hypothetical protein